MLPPRCTNWQLISPHYIMYNSCYIGATTLSKMTIGITTFRIMGLLTTLSITILSIDIQHNSIECHYAECCDYLNVMLSVVMLNVVMLNAVRLNVVRLSVVAPLHRHKTNK
jgi:hypothetical protein